MAIKIEIEHWEYDCDNDIEKCVFTDQFIVNDLDSNLMDCVRKISESDYSACFESYYPNIAPDSIYDSGFPYILKEGEYEWHVPVEQVSVRDFMATHDIHDGGIISLYEGVIGGAVEVYISTIVEWIPIILSEISMIVTAKDIYKFIMPIYQKLIGKDGKAASPYEFIEMLSSRDTWTMKDLKSRTALDEKTIECMLIQAGFEKLGAE